MWRMQSIPHNKSEIICNLYAHFTYNISKITYIMNPEIELAIKSLPTLKELVDKYEDNPRIGIKEIESLRMSPKFMETSKPHLNKNHTSDDAKIYAKALAEYEKIKLENEAHNKELRPYNQKVTELLENFMKEVSGLNKNVPEKSRDKVWSKANYDGHSSGNGEVFTILIDLIDLFE